MQYNILIGGSAGQGIETVSILLEKILKRKGYFVYSTKDYMSRVRGGHNFIQIRWGDEIINSHYPDLDLIVAMDITTVDTHKGRLKDKGLIVCDESLKIEDKRAVLIPAKKTAVEAGNARAFGTVAVAAVLSIFGIEYDNVEDVFSKKWEKETRESNIKAFKEGLRATEKYFEAPKEQSDNHILINGNDSIAMGALAGGLSFYSAYPMTPATSIMTFLSKKSFDAGIVVEQVEDEISAINMALGASYAGARSMTGSSGGGLSLMVEAIGLSSITEIPIVIVDSQRPGPATGLPTRTEQSDLSFLVTASHGEGPRMIIAVRHPEDAFYQTARALNLADKYQIPVIILTDQYLADTTATVNKFDFSKVTIERNIAGAEALENEDYKRYKITESGVSPRLIPGKLENTVVLIDSDEHTEEGHITESAEVRNSMMEKRMRKFELLKDELIEPDYFGAERPEVLLLAWGSLYGPVKEAVEMLQRDNMSIGVLIFGDLYPLPTKLLKKYSSFAKKIINVEQNYTGQLAKLISMETGLVVTNSIVKYDGRQISSYEIYSRVKKEVL